MNDQNNQAGQEMFFLFVIAISVFVIFVYAFPLILIFYFWGKISPDDRVDALKALAMTLIGGVGLLIFIDVKNPEAYVFGISIGVFFSLIPYSWRTLLGVPPKEKIIEQNAQIDHLNVEDSSEFNSYDGFDFDEGEFGMKDTNEERRAFWIKLGEDANRNRNKPNNVYEPLGLREGYEKHKAKMQANDFASEWDREVEKEQAQSDFASEYDARKKARTRIVPPKLQPQPKIVLPKGVELRHPEDAKYWARVDDPASAKEERIRALSFLISKEKKRGQVNLPVGELKIPYGVDKRKTEEAGNWLVVDDPTKAKTDRLRALRVIANNEERRNGIVNSKVEFI